jgi:hypothetical protein
MVVRSRGFIYSALALLVLLCAQRADARKFLDAIGDADRAILQDLHDGRVVEAYPFGANQNMGSLWKVRIENNGRSRWAIFKPRQYGDRDGWARTPMEAAMYKLNRILGMDMVPPTAYRRNLWINGQQFGEGALMIWVDDAHKALNVGDREWKPGREAFSSDLRVLQALGRDADNQNGANIVRGRHWKDGKYRVMKVDNEACLRNGASVALDHAHPEWGAITRFNRQTYDRLKELNFNDLKGDLGEFVSDDEIRGWLSARDGLVRAIDDAARQRQNVFFNPGEINFDASKRYGKRASAKTVAKFENLLRRKGVGLEKLEACDARVAGAAGRTVLTADGIVVRLPATKRGVAKATLLEELVHVNQLQTMAKQTGGLGGLYQALSAKDKASRAVRASMEEYALSKVARTVDGKERRRVEGARQRMHERAARCSGGACDTRTLWKSVGTTR